MKYWVFGVVLAVAASVSSTSAQEECSSGKPFRLISTITPVVGKSPLWVTTGAGPINWTGANNPVQALWVRDLAVRGPALLAGKRRDAADKARFARVTLGMPEERFKFDLMGERPKTVTPADLAKYSFHRTFIWFPSPGCYQMTARVGTEQAVLYLNVVQGAAKE